MKIRNLLFIPAILSVLFSFAVADEIYDVNAYDRGSESALVYYTKLIFTPRYFEPHSIHFVNDTGLLWVTVISNAFIFIAYTLIPIALIYFIRKRKDLIFTQIFFLFGAFIILCGFHHLIHLISFWYPIYYFEGIVDTLTAIVSMLTFFALLPILPLAIKLRSPKELEDVNIKLTDEIKNKEKIEKDLLSQKEDLAKMNKFMVDRENVMVELKKEIEDLKKQLENK